MKNNLKCFFEDTTSLSCGNWVRLEGAGSQRIAAVEDRYEVWLENLDRSVAICELSPIPLPEMKSQKIKKDLINNAKIEVHYIHELQHLLHLISDEALKISCVELIENFSRNEIYTSIP